MAVQPIRTGSIQDGRWLVLDGLKSGEKVVVEGFQKFAAGDKVQPRPWQEEAEADGLPKAGGATSVGD